MEFLFLSAIFITSFVSFLLLTKKEKTISDLILFVWLMSAVISLIAFYLIQTRDFSYPNFIALSIAMPILQCPSLFLYVKYQTEFQKFKCIDLLHYLPVIIISFLYFEFYLLDPKEKVTVLTDGAVGFELANTLKLTTIYLSGLIYIPLALLKLYKYKKSLKESYSNIEKINLNWLVYLILGISIIWFVVYLIQDDRVIFGLASVYLIWLAYFGTKQVNIFNNNHYLNEIKSNSNVVDEVLNFIETKPSEKSITEKKINPELNVVAEKINVAINIDKLFLNPELTLNDLAEQINETSTLVSNAINQVNGKNFYDLINEKRITEFLSQVNLPENKNYTLLSIAYDCGFNSKSSFNRNFKKITGKTPKEYLESHEII